MLYVSIDPATSTGWACFEIEIGQPDSTTAAVTFGQFRVNTRTKTGHGDWCLDMERRIDALLDTLLAFDANGGRPPPSIAHAFVEDYFFSARACNGVTINVKFRAVIEMCLRRRGIEYTLVHPASWFADVVGSVPKRTATQERKKRTMLALEARYGIVVPSHDGRRKTPSDVYDAIAIGVHALSRRHPNVRFVSPAAATAVEGGDDGVGAP
jgi:hypothetical protein